MTALPRLGLSRCLLGEAVRYNGGHKRLSWLELLRAQNFEWVSICPEVEAGLGTPRPPMGLVRVAGVARLRVHGSGVDHTEAMQRAIERRLVQLRRDPLDGYLLQPRSPSCGLRAIPLVDERGEEVARRDGLWVQALRAEWPALPLAESEALDSDAARAAFFDQVRAHHAARCAI